MATLVSAADQDRAYGICLIIALAALFATLALLSRSSLRAEGQQEAEPCTRAQLAHHDVRQTPFQARDLAPVRVAPAVVAVAVAQTALLGDQLLDPVD